MASGSSNEESQNGEVCDGKACGLGKYAGGNGKYVCPHNNLTVMKPELMREWDWDKNTLDPTKLSSGSRKKVWWRCTNDPCGCHLWEARIHNRTGGGNGCPFCSDYSDKVCKHSNLETEHARL